MQTMHPSHPSPEDVLAQMGEDLPSGSPSRQLPSDRRGHRSQHLSVLLKTNPTPQPVRSSVCPALLHSLGQSPAPEDQGSSLNPGGRDPGLPRGAWGSQSCCHPFFFSTTCTVSPFLPLLEGVPPSPACEGLKLE